MEHGCTAQVFGLHQPEGQAVQVGNLVVQLVEERAEEDKGVVLSTDLC